MEKERQVVEPSMRKDREQIRIGAVSYLNSKPLVYGLAESLPTARLMIDLPSRLADGLAQGKIDVALVPSIEYFRSPGYTVVSDACVACDGPVKSVKLYGRVPVNKIRVLALDEGSRTSAALTQILLRERFGVVPKVEPLAIGKTVEDSSADAVMLIGDRAMRRPTGKFEFVWDMGHMWSQWMGLPVVFAMWVARPGLDLQGLGKAFSVARDRGVSRLDEIARREARKLGLDFQDCRTYLSQQLRFQLGDRERRGLEIFRELAVRHHLIPDGVRLVFHDPEAA
jgi:chorismate dehydratase